MSHPASIFSLRCMRVHIRHVPSSYYFCYITAAVLLSSPNVPNCVQRKRERTEEASYRKNSLRSDALVIIYSHSCCLREVLSFKALYVYGFKHGKLMWKAGFFHMRMLFPLKCAWKCVSLTFGNIFIGPIDDQILALFL